jgi:hypothetical protein
MKNLFLCCIASFTLLSFSSISAQTKLGGSWKSGNSVMIATENYFVQATFDTVAKRFDGTLGGTYTQSGSTMSISVEFSTPETSYVGQTADLSLEEKDGKLIITTPIGEQTWERITEPEATALTGLWRITGRVDKEGKMSEIKPSARKTIKLLTANRFQWMAINTETGEFFGSGGGTYTLKDGKYTETIEFFSRDSTRVGMSLGFDAKTENGKWEHMGKSSKGDPVHEVWTKQ